MLRASRSMFAWNFARQNAPFAFGLVVFAQPA
jgi:hypothetical protein